MGVMGEETLQHIGSRLGDLKDLPDELLRQLPSARMDDLEREIIDIIGSVFDGAASVDEVFVALYRKTNVIHDRRKLSSKLYRMVNSKPPLLEAVAKRRGVYRLPE